jgi:predicted nucleic acid-binding protein
MIADTTFLSHWMRERRGGVTGPATTFFVEHRKEIIRTSIISLTEVAVLFRTSSEAWAYFKQWTVYRLHDGIAQVAADVDRRLSQRLGENDNWIAAFCLYHRQPIISLDAAFDRVPRLRRLIY